MKRLLIGILCLLLWVSSSSAATYYYRQNGTGNSTSCANAGSISSLNNGSFSSGDIVILCNDGGTITPVISLDSSHNGIIIQNESGATTTLSYGFLLTNANDVTIRTNPAGGLLQIIESTHENVQFVDSDRNSVIGLTMRKDTGTFDGHSDYTMLNNDINSVSNLYLNNTISRGCAADVFRVSGARTAIIGNNIHNSTHTLFRTTGNADYTIVKDNIFENNMHHSNSAPATGADYGLMTGNIYRNAGTDCGDGDCEAGNPCGWGGNPATNSFWGTDNSISQHIGPISRNIFRFNLYYSDDRNSTAQSFGGADGSISHNIHYNNTFADACRFLRGNDGNGNTLDNNTWFNNIWTSGRDASCYKTTVYSWDWETSQSNNKFFGNTIHDVGPIRFKALTNVSVGTLQSTYPNEVYSNTTINPNLDGDYRLTASSTGQIDAAQPHLTINDSGGGSGTTVTVDSGQASRVFTKEEWGVTSHISPHVSNDVVWNQTDGWTAEVTAVNPAGNTITLASYQTWSDNAELFILPNGVACSGGGCDVGWDEYDSGVPSGDGTSIYELESNGNDSEGNNDLTCQGSCEYASNGINVDDDGDGYLRGLVNSPNLDNTQISVIVQFSIDNFTDGSAYPLVSRWDSNGGRNWSINVGKSSREVTGSVGYNSGASVEWILGHGYQITAGVTYWACLTIDGSNKLADIYVTDNSGNTLGTDMSNSAILSGRTWSHTLSSLTIGSWEDGGVSQTNYISNGIIKYAEIRTGIITKTDFVNIVTGASPPGPKAIDNYWCDESMNPLTQDIVIAKPGIPYYHCVEWSEGMYNDGGPGGWTGQVTLGVTGGSGMSGFAGYGTTVSQFRGISGVSQRSGALQISSSDPIDEGTTDIIDSESNSFDTDGDSGLDTSLTHTPILAIPAIPHSNFVQGGGSGYAIGR